MQPSSHASLAPLTLEELLPALDAGEPLLLLDVRNEEDFAAWRIEARKPIESRNIPYFAFLEDEAAALARLPRALPIVAVCAKGGSSELVVELLRNAGLSARNLAGGMAAYVDHLEPTAVSFSTGGRFELWQVNRRGKGCLSYVVRAGDEALVIDPSRRVEWYERFVAQRGARVAWVLDTHVHADHLSGGPALAARTGAHYAAGGGPGAALADRARLRLGGPAEAAVELELVATPGHTPGSASFLLENRYLFSGDTLFVRGIGRPDLGGQAEAWGRILFRTLHGRLARLADDTVILPGHTAGLDEANAQGVVRGALGELRRGAEFLIAAEDEFVARVAGSVQPAPEAYAAIVRANLVGAAVEEERAAEWEIGKNRCATSAPTTPRAETR